VPNASVVLGGSGTSRTVTLTPAPNLSGTTTITISANDGALTTTRAFLLTVTAVNDAPTITAIADQVINEDGATTAIAFTVGDVETAAGSLTLSGGSSNTTLVPIANIVFGGSGASRTVTVTPAANQNGTATITVTVSDGSLSAPTSFLLTVVAEGGFTNDPLSAGTSVIRAVHITELRTRIDAQRVRFGLAAFVWTDSNLAGVVVKAVHVIELRSALLAAYVQAGRTPLPVFTDTLTAGQTGIRVVHIAELRAAVVAIE
jgi:hypothetical protein